MEEQQAAEVPSYFLCPISLGIMRDPVTLPSGITYDRDGIERWLLAGGSCPMTKQPVAADCEPTPNHTLRRLIHSWCALHADVDGVETVSTPKKPPVDRARLAALVSEIDAKRSSSSQELLAALRELNEVTAESERNKQLLTAVPGAADVLAAIFVASSTSENAAACDEALGIISSLHLSEECRLRVVERNDEALVDALVSSLQRSKATSRTHAAQLLQDVAAVMSPTRLASLPEQAFREAMQLLRNDVSRPATRAALQFLVGTASWGRNRVKAVDAGAVAALVDVLVDCAHERRACELALAALDRLCGCADGRAELVAHGAGVAVVGRKILRVSDAATGKAVRVLRSVARHAATAAVVQEMAQTGVVRKLCLVAQSEQGCERTRERARETLRLHARAWRTSPCLHPHLQAMYPC